MPDVDLLVADELLPELPQALDLLHATEVDRATDGTGTTRVTLDLPYAPEDAIGVEPTFQATPDGVRLQSLVWVFSDDTADDPPVQCWHTEPTTPCDWNICRQPERLVAGDRGIDPAEM